METEGATTTLQKLNQAELPDFPGRKVTIVRSELNNKLFIGNLPREVNTVLHWGNKRRMLCAVVAQLLVASVCRCQRIRFWKLSRPMWLVSCGDVL